jgi:hypothetical protein
MIVQLKTGRNTSSISAFKLAMHLEGGGKSEYFNIDPPGPNSFNTYDVPINVGVMDVRGVRFLVKGNLGSRWQLEFVNVTDKSTGIWRWEPHVTIPINQFPDLWYMYDVGVHVIDPRPPPDSYPCGYWVSVSDHREFCNNEFCR